MIVPVPVVVVVVVVVVVSVWAKTTDVARADVMPSSVILNFIMASVEVCAHCVLRDISESF